MLCNVISMTHATAFSRNGNAGILVTLIGPISAHTQIGG